MSPLLVVWFLSCLAETNRSPFDFVEGEREIVSGFNIEYSASGFVIIFISEYLIMLFLRALRYIIFTPHFRFCGVGAGVFCFLFVWVRARLPRLRYDVLINLCWKILLPISLLFFFLFFLMCRL